MFPLFKKVVFTGAARAFGAVCGLAFNITVTKTLGVEGAGEFFLCLSLMTTVSLVTRFGIPTYMVQTGSHLWHEREYSEFSRATALCLMLAFLISLAATLCGGLASGFASDFVFHKPFLKPLLLLFSLALLPFTLTWVVGGVLRARAQVSIAMLIETGAVPLCASALVWLIADFRPISSQLVAIAYLAACASIVGAGAFLIVRGGNRIEWLSLADLNRRARQIMPYSVRAMISTLTSNLILWVPFFVLGRIGLSQDLGLFGTALRTAAMINLVLIVINGVFLPRLAISAGRGDWPAFSREYRKAALAALGITIPLLIAIILFGSKLMMLYGHGFVEATGLFQLLMFLFIAAMIFGPADEAMLMANRAHAAARFGTLAVVLSGIASSAIIPRFGAVGAAWVTGCSLVAYKAVCLYSLYSVKLRETSPAVQ